MSDVSWMEEEAYEIADRFSQALSKAYEQGVADAWSNTQMLWNRGTFSVELSANEMMHYAEMEDKHLKDVEKLAEEMGIHALYAVVRSMRGEDDD